MFNFDFKIVPTLSSVTTDISSLPSGTYFFKSSKFKFTSRQPSPSGYSKWWNNVPSESLNSIIWIPCDELNLKLKGKYEFKLENIMSSKEYTFNNIDTLS